jgi:F-type H+-transporting ATPase subunit alpha
MVELLKQSQYQPMDVAEQVISIYAGTRGHLDDIAVTRVKDFETGLLQYVKDRKPELLKQIRDVADLTSEIEESIKSAIAAFKASFK